MMISPCCHAACYVAGWRNRNKNLQGITQWYACSSCGEACDPITDVPDADVHDG
jgi:hypothetical protein